jgi:hypothetical protein
MNYNLDVEAILKNRMLPTRALIVRYACTFFSKVHRSMLVQVLTFFKRRNATDIPIRRLVRLNAFKRINTPLVGLCVHLHTCHT